MNRDRVRPALPVVGQWAAQISRMVHAAREEGAYIQERTPTAIAAAFRDGAAYYAAGPEGIETFCAVAPLVPVQHFAQYPICELGTLIANPDRPATSTSRAWERVRDALQDYRGSGVLLLATSRGEASARALERGGMISISWGEHPMLAALTCDPTCREAIDGRPAWLNCGTRVVCAACSSVAEGVREDSCHLYVSNGELAAELNARLSEVFHDDALELRSAFGLGVER